MSDDPLKQAKADQIYIHLIMGVIKFAPLVMAFVVAVSYLRLQLWIVPQLLAQYYNADMHAGMLLHILGFVVWSAGVMALGDWLTGRGIFNVFDKFNARVVDSITDNVTKMVGSKLTHDADINKNVTDTMLGAWKAGVVMGKAQDGELTREGLLAALEQLEAPGTKAMPGTDRWAADRELEEHMNELRRQRLSD